MAIAVNCFVTDPKRNCVSIVTGRVNRGLRSRSLFHTYRASIVDDHSHYSRTVLLNAFYKDSIEAGRQVLSEDVDAN